MRLLNKSSPLMLRLVAAMLGIFVVLLAVGCVIVARDFVRTTDEIPSTAIHRSVVSVPQSSGDDEAEPTGGAAAPPSEALSPSIASVVLGGGGVTWTEFLDSRAKGRHGGPAEIEPILDNNARSRLPVNSISHLEFPSVPVAALPLFNVSVLYRTALIREKPRHCFIVNSVNTNAAVNATSLIGQLQLVSTLTPERIPIIPICHEDQIAAIGEPIPPSGPHAQYEVGFVFDGERCSTNMWHGLLEVVVPIFGAKTLVALRDLGFDLTQLTSNDAGAYRRSMLTSALAAKVVARLLDDQRSARHVLFMKAPRKNIWGVHNLGCPILNHYPYGWTTSSVSGWLLYSLFDPVVFGSDGWPKPVANPLSPASRSERTGDPMHMMFFGETPTTNRKYEMRLFGASRTVLVKDALFYGPSALCRWSRAFAMPPKPASPPYYLHGDALCPFVYEVTKKYALSIVNITEAVVTAASLACPKVGIVVRRTLHNGRGMRNFDEIVAALSMHVANGGPFMDAAKSLRMFAPSCGVVRVVNLEGDIPFGQQIESIHDLDVVIGARGMGLTNSIFMKKNAGLLVWSGREIMAALNVANDNYPWNPLHALRPSNPVVLSSCPVVFPTPDSMKRVIAEAAQHPNRTAAQETATYAKRCVTRSVNFCDVRCDVAKTIKDFDRLMFMMKVALDGSGTSNNGEGNAAELQDMIHIADRW